MNQREVYPSAPLHLVALEIKFPTTSRVLTRPLWDALEEALSDNLPDVQFLVDDPESGIPRQGNGPVLRRISRERKRAVTLYTGAVTIELADYRSYEDLQLLTETTLAALNQGAQFLRCTRMGLRYINEIKSELVLEPDDKWQTRKLWVPYINGDLLHGVKKAPEGLCAFGHRGIKYFHSMSGPEQASLDYGIHNEGLVNPNDVLILDEWPGPCFVLDIDAYHYTSPKEEPPDNKELISMLDRLHEIVEAVFQWSITDRSREVFRAPARSRSDESLLPASNA